eukprot:TRINITY_DN24345_c0_g1_i1.p1 TRINITY_DN24345_c0_g1~~TRINITY_DN24345_c0_g1_i1.p1  ORF type:complete len:269 (-),score=22.49 TRINITY_DN24345_c0_g1_i1:170-976(-)
MEYSLPSAESESYNEAQSIIEDLSKLHGFRRPFRGDIEDPEIKWRVRKPDYLVADSAFFQGRSMNHEKGSLEDIVENLVKTWEMEASHKTDFNQWTTVDHENYQVSANGHPFIPGDRAKEMGNYNWLLAPCLKHLWDSDKADFETSHKSFNAAFPDGFPWELLKVLSGPPVVVFTWRHWANFSGTYTDPISGWSHVGENQLIELFGLARVKVNAELKIQDLEVFYKPEDFLKVLKGEVKADEISKGRSLLGPCCPFIKQNQNSQELRK